MHFPIATLVEPQFIMFVVKNFANWLCASLSHTFDRMGNNEIYIQIYDIYNDNSVSSSNRCNWKHVHVHVNTYSLTEKVTIGSSVGLLHYKSSAIIGHPHSIKIL